MFGTRILLIELTLNLFITAGFVDTLYSWSAFNTEEIGKVIADSLVYLIKTYPIEKIHLIGMSNQVILNTIWFSLLQINCNSNLLFRQVIVWELILVGIHRFRCIFLCYFINCAIFLYSWFGWETFIL